MSEKTDNLALSLASALIANGMGPQAKIAAQIVRERNRAVDALHEIADGDVDPVLFARRVLANLGEEQ